MRDPYCQFQDMELSADLYYDQAELMDIRVLGTLGLTDEDVEELKKIEGVQSVNPSYSQDVLCQLPEFSAGSSSDDPYAGFESGDCRRRTSAGKSG